MMSLFEHYYTPSAMSQPYFSINFKTEQRLTDAVQGGYQIADIKLWDMSETEVLLANN